MLLPDKILPVYRDSEAIILDQIDEYYEWEPGTHSGDQTPGDEALEDVLPFVRVGRVGGAPVRGSEHTDRPVIDIDVFARTRSEAYRIAREIEQLLMARKAPLDDVNVLMSPQRVPWVEGVPITRFYASYQASLRR